MASFAEEEKHARTVLRKQCQTDADRSLRWGNRPLRPGHLPTTTSPLALPPHGGWPAVLGLQPYVVRPMPANSYSPRSGGFAVFRVASSRRM
jgi:hypothetical protein